MKTHTRRPPQTRVPIRAIPLQLAIYAAVALAAASLPTQAQAALTNCKEVEVFDPPDGTRIDLVCESDCQAPLSGDELEQCAAELCDRPGAENSDLCRKAASCSEGEELRGGSCVKRPDRVAMADDGMCISAADAAKLERKIDEAEELANRRLRVAVLAVAARQIPITLADGSKVTADPESDDPRSKRLAARIEELATKEGVRCEVTATPLSATKKGGARCVDALDTLRGKITEDFKKTFRQAQEIAAPTLMAPDFAECVAQSAAAAKEKDTSDRALVIGREFTAVSQIIDAVSEGQGESVLVPCQGTDLSTCGLQLDPANPPKPPPAPPKTGDRPRSIGVGRAIP